MARKSKLNLELMAQELEQEESATEVEETIEQETEGTVEKKNEETVEQEVKKDEAINKPKPKPKQPSNKNDSNVVEKKTEELFKLPFVVAMQNVGVSESDIIDAGRELLTTGKITKRFDLMMGNYIVLTSRKASEELDYYTFIAEAISKQLTNQEFEYLMRVRNIAVSMVEISIAGEVVKFNNKAIEEKYEYLLNLTAPMVSLILNATTKFWSIMMLTIHPGFVDFLSRNLQK